jgi:hypothetical protein
MIRSFLHSVGTHYSVMDVLPAFGRTTGRATTLVKMDGNCGRRFGSNEANRSDKTGIALLFLCVNELLEYRAHLL